MSYTFASPQLLKRYSDKTIRVVTHKKISTGDEIVYKNENWIDEKRIVKSVLEERPSMGTFEGEAPTSYKLEV